MDLGVRWSAPASERDSNDNVGEDFDNAVEIASPVATIETTMVAEYAMAEDPGKMH